MKPVKKIALLHSMCGVGKASLTNMMPILSVLGIEASPVPTIVLSTHTGGFGTPIKQEISPEYIRACADHYRENNVIFDAIFVGYLGSNEVLSAVQYFVKQFPNAIKILDPIMGDHGNFYSNIGQQHVESFRELCSDMDLMIPNYTEACFLAGQTYQDSPSDEFLSNLCEELHKTNVKEIIITSAPMSDGNRGILLSNKAGVNQWSIEIEPTEFHGTGDVFDAVVIGKYLQECPLNEAITSAHQFVVKCIQDSCNYAYPKREGLLLEPNLATLV